MRKIENLKTLYLTNRNDWRRWLEINFKCEKEVWLVFPRKSTGKPCMSYNDAVEEALCFGWIDSTLKRLDDQHSMQRFLLRKNKAYYSQPNRERLKWLWEHDLIHSTVKDEVERMVRKEFVFPPDILDRIRQDEMAWENYQTYSGSYQRIRVTYIDAARKRPEEFEKRLTNFLSKTRKNKLIAGYGGIDKYY